MGPSVEVLEFVSYISWGLDDQGIYTHTHTHTHIYIYIYI